MLSLTFHKKKEKKDFANKFPTIASKDNKPHIFLFSEKGNIYPNSNCLALCSKGNCAYKHYKICQHLFHLYFHSKPKRKTALSIRTTATLKLMSSAYVFVSVYTSNTTTPNLLAPF